MSFRDILSMAFNNLWRMKLRSSLTILGVVIGIAALVSMMSFGAGMQKNVAESFQSFELLTSLQVLPSTARSGAPANQQDHYDPDMAGSEADTLPGKPLNDEAIRIIGQIPGVKSVYPEETFAIRVQFGEKTVNTTARSLPAAQGDLAAYKAMAAGRFFSSDSAHEVVIHKNLLRRLGVTDPDSIIGQPIELISAKISISAAMGRFMGGGKVNPFIEVRYPFTVCGVLGRGNEMGPMDLRNLLVPLQSARAMERLSFSNPYEMLSQVNSPQADQYSSLTVRMVSLAAFDAVRDSVEALGYKTFSFADFFEEMKKGFLIFDAILGVVGFIALIVASLGIVNTMVMSILERYREIGVLKSLGADNAAVRWLFLVESGVIGFWGAVLGLLFGWVITRVGAVIARYYMAKQGAPEMELFALPLWLIVLALTFGIGVSLLAGLYPAARATKVDPVKALRHD